MPRTGRPYVNPVAWCVGFCKDVAAKACDGIGGPPSLVLAADGGEDENHILRVSQAVKGAWATCSPSWNRTRVEGSGPLLRGASCVPSTPSPFQAQKEELQSLMRQPKGLEEENAQLRGAVQQGQASQRALEAELQQLRAQLQGLEADCVRGTDGVCLSWGRGPQGGRVTKEQGPRGQEPGPGFPQQKEGLEAETQALRLELERQQRLLGSVQGLERGVRDADRGDPAHTGLAQKLPGLEGWGQHPGLSANASEAWGHGSPFQSSRERSGKEKWRDGQGDRKAEHWKQKKEDSGRERKKSWGGEWDREPAGRWQEEWGRGRDGGQQGPKELPRKSGSPHPSRDRQKHPQWKEGAEDGRGPLPPWAELSRHKYRAPQGCAGVLECARQEGLALFGVELAPVRRQELAALLRTYLARLPWAGRLTEELPLSPAYFGEDGVFRHDRLRFRDFVDALEDSLEEVAVRHTGDDDEVDDFEDFIFRHFFGDKALKKRWAAVGELGALGHRREQEAGV